LIQAHPAAAEYVAVAAGQAGARSQTVISQPQVTGFQPPDSGRDTLSALSDDA
jgi:hypothetical protein